ncbi:unnamed protein product [Blepharisma stoltei]|uniref:FYVE-type domain-containing protein n=1 Tax=Blepharisma stoltei TaxID=1481888 RepID=A0AAU9K2D6_9CILI|nr:unnamed protein product [Blepharisma stoltei]
MRLSDIIINSSQSSQDSTPVKLNKNSFNPLNFESPDFQKTYELCNCCKQNFPLSSRSHVCKNCKTFNCSKHLILENRYDAERICEACYKEKISIQRYEELKEVEETIQKEIQLCLHEREKKTILLTKEITHTKSLRKQLKTYSAGAEEKAKLLELQVSLEKEEVLKLKESLEMYEGQKEAKKYTEDASNRWLTKIQMEYSEKASLENSLESQISELKTKNNSLENTLRAMIPIETVAENLCKICLLKCKSVFASVPIPPKLKSRISSRFVNELVRDKCACQII